MAAAGPDPETCFQVAELLYRLGEAQLVKMAQPFLLDSRSAGGLAAALKAAGVRGEGGAIENLSAGYDTLAEAFSGWRQSPAHNGRMLDARARRMGLAAVYAPGSKFKVFWALVLAD